MQPDPYLKALRETFQLEQLLGRSRGREFFLMGYRMRDGDIAEARLLRSRAAPFRRRGRFCSAAWQPEPRGIGARRDPIIIDSLELPSFVHAETELLRLLGEFHVPVRLRPITDGLGDLAFATPDESFVAVLRGNALLRLAQTRPTQSLLRVAQDVDTRLVTKPAGAEEAPDLIAVEAAEQQEALARSRAPEGMLVPRAARQYTVSYIRMRRALRLDDGSNEASQTPMVRFFSRGGWIEERDELRFNLEAPEEDGEAELEVFEENPQGPARQCTCRFAGGRWYRHDDDKGGET